MKIQYQIIVLLIFISLVSTSCRNLFQARVLIDYKKREKQSNHAIIFKNLSDTKILICIPELETPNYDYPDMYEEFKLFLDLSSQNKMMFRKKDLLKPLTLKWSFGWKGEGQVVEKIIQLEPKKIKENKLVILEFKESYTWEIKYK